MVLSRLIYILLGLFLHVSILAMNGTEMDSIATDLAVSLKKIIDSNEENDRNNNSHLNEYNLIYLPGSGLMTTASCSYPYTQKFDPFLDGCNPIDLPWWDDLETSICDFNASNQNDLKLYNILFLYFQDINESDLLTGVETQNVGIMPYLKGVNPKEHLAKYKDYMSLMTAKIQSEFDFDNFNNANEKIINISQMNTYCDMGIPQVGVMTDAKVYIQSKVDSYYAVTDFMSEETFEDAIDFIDSYYAIDESIVFPYSAFYKRVAGLRDYFGGLITVVGECSDLKKEPNGGSSNCSDPDHIMEVENFLNHWCANITNPSDETKKFLYVVKEYFHDGYSCLLLDFDSPIPNGATDWHYTVVQDYLVKMQPMAPAQPIYSRWEDYLLQEKIVAPATPADVNKYDLILWLKFTSVADHESLTYLERARVLKAIQANYTLGSGFPDYLRGLIREILSTAENKSPGYVEDFLGELQSHTFLDWLFWDVCDAFFSFEDTQFQVMKSLTTLGLKNFQESEKFTFTDQHPGKCFIWKISPWTQTLVDHYKFSNPDVMDTGNNPALITFDWEYCSGMTTDMVDNGMGGVTWETTPVFTNKTFDQLNPWDIIAVAGGGNDEVYHWSTDCGNIINSGDCNFKVKFMPAIVFAWYIEKQNDGHAFKAFMTSLAVAGALLSAAEFVVVVTAETVSLVAATIYGAIFLIDLAAVVAPTMTGTYLEANTDMPPDSIAAIVSRVETVSSYAGGGAGAFMITRGLFKGVASYWRLSSFGTNVVNGNTESFEKLVLNIESIIKADPEGLPSVLDKFGFNSTIKTYIVESVSDDKMKAILTGFISNKPALQNITNTSKLNFLEESLINSDLCRAVMEMGDLKLISFLDDFLFTGYGPFISNPNRLRAYRALHLDPVKRIDDVWLTKIAASTGKSEIASTNPYTVNWTNNLVSATTGKSAQDLWNATDNCLFYGEGDIIFKYNYATGEMLVGNKTSNTILGFYEGSFGGVENLAEIVVSSSPEAILGVLKKYHGVSASAQALGVTVTSGANITSNLSKSSTILGRFTPDMTAILAEFKNLKQAIFSGNINGFNLLNVSDEFYDVATFWAVHNKPWLQQAINRLANNNEVIWAASSPLVKSNIISVGTGNFVDPSDLKTYLQGIPDETSPLFAGLTGYGKEVWLMLKENNMNYDDVGKIFIF